jgi:hypothetical protein
MGPVDRPVHPIRGQKKQNEYCIERKDPFHADQIY